MINAIMANKFTDLPKEKLIALIMEQEKIIESLMEQLNLYRYDKFNSKSEKDTKDNDNTFDEAIPPDNKKEIEDADEEISVKAHTRKKSSSGKKTKGRKPLPNNLPRIEILYDIDDKDKRCSCGVTLSPLKDSVSEQLEIIPTKLVVKKHIRKNYCCSHCDNIFKSASMPKQPIPKSIAAPGLLSHILVSKFQDHLPLYRMEMILQRIGIDIARATLCSWVIKCAKLLNPLYELLKKNIITYDISYADETTVQVLKEKDRKASSKSYMWVFGGGSPDKFCYIYNYNQSRSHEVPLDILEGFSGHLHCDGYSGYEALSNKMNISLVACWYHARRKFIEVQKVTKKSGGLSGKFLDIIKKLSIIEATAKDENLNSDARYQLRQEKAKPLLLKYKKILDDSIDTAPPKSLIGKAMKYSQNQWPKLIKYLEDGRLEISNNLMERKVKPFVIGRKNWLFYD
jgi:transposase